jgi:hypothetical protein
MINYKTGEPSQIKQISLDDIILPYENSTLIAGFVLNALNNKRGGSFIEVGSSHWKNNNNTYILEKEFGWHGVGIEIQEHFVESYNANRTSRCIHGDALTFKWDEYLEKNNFPKTIDFLQIDVDDIVPNSNLLAFLNIPLSRYQFNIICVENIANIDLKYVGSRDAQREILYANGYVLIASLFTDDWWIHSSLNDYPMIYDQIKVAAWKREFC